MSDVVEDFISASRDGNIPSAEPEPVEPEAATPEPEPVVEAAPADVPPRQKFKLDDVDLDDDRLPPSLRGKPASLIFEERSRAITEVQRLANERNRLEAERNAFKEALEIAAKKLEAAQPAPPPKATPIDRMRSRGVEATGIYSDAERTLGAAIEAGAEEAEGRIRPEIEKLTEKINQLEAAEAQKSQAAERQGWRDAYLQAKPANVSSEDWDEFAGVASAFVLQAEMPLGAKSSYETAYNWFRKSGSRIAGVAPAPTVPAPAPAAPAPPIGSARPAPVARSKPTAHLSNHERHAFAATANIFKEQAPSIDVDEILSDLSTDPKLKGMFP